jgi:hypothetical protein
VFIKNGADTRLNNATSTKQTVNSTTGLVVLASDQGTRHYLHNYDSLALAPPVTPATTPAQAPTAIATPTQTPISAIAKRSFLPLIRQSALPDLVGSIALTPNKLRLEAGEPVEISVTITNIGAAPSTPAWADVYISPSTPPSAPGTPWNTVCGLQPCFGLVWVVPALDPGQSVTLRSTVGSYAQPYSIWPGWFAGGTSALYLYVDSWNPGVFAGAVVESDESNNRAERHGLQVSGTNPTLAHPPAADLPARGRP